MDVDEVDGGCFGKPQKIYLKSDENYYKDDEELRNTTRNSVQNNNVVDQYYKMNNQYRGHALIFNHYKFKAGKFKERNGTHKDNERIKKTLLSLNFEVDEFRDLDYKYIQEHVKSAASKNYDDKDCVVVVILSHGDPNIVYANDQPYNPKSLWSKFCPLKNPTLKGKPVIFIINACQGSKYDHGIYFTETKSNYTDSNFNESEIDTKPLSKEDMSHMEIPDQSDLLLIYSTAPGYYSWRSPDTGSWFIQTFCEILDELKYKEDLLTILTIVICRVAYDYESRGLVTGKKQVPCFFSKLTKLLKFEESDEIENKCCVN
ncbi:caspase-1-like isoform X2 [Aethina tumida]|uniref:caspase-1-like isoform X2 n=1 Tax=Aethina tumida TaxID=116153 RepID=UPI0021479223|nr:caspase-1-like isoform X2 [Aethina tumida]